MIFSWVILRFSLVLNNNLSFYQYADYKKAPFIIRTRSLAGNLMCVSLNTSSLPFVHLRHHVGTASCTISFQVSFTSSSSVHSIFDSEQGLLYGQTFLSKPLLSTSFLLRAYCLFYSRLPLTNVI